MAVFDRDDTYGKVVDIVVQKLHVNKDTVTQESTFQELGADSLGMVEIMMKLEETFGVEIEDGAAEKLTNMREAVDYIQSKRTK